MTESDAIRPALPATPGRIVAILGMHRSGTSLLAGTLEECGLDLGNVTTWAPANEKGNRESWALMALHEDLLRKAGGGWDRQLQRPVAWGPLHRGVRDAYIASFAGKPLWGFKDPRLLFVLDGWLEALPALETVAIFRHPLEVAKSLRQRTPERFSAEAALDLWLDSNRRLLDWQARLGFPVVEYLADGAAFNRLVATIARQLRLPGTVDSSALTFFESGLRHQSAGKEPMPQAVAEVYAELRARSAQTFGAAPP